MWFPEQAERVRALSPEGFGFVLVLLLAGSLFAFYSIWRGLHRARLIEDLPTARVRSAHQGYVELEGSGRLLDGPPIVAPLTGTHCLWYRYRVEQRETHRDSRGNSSSHWSTVQAGISDGLFVLDDGTGRCIIDPEGAEVIPGARDVWYGRQALPRSGPPAGRTWLRFSGGDFRYTEERLMPGPIYALGWFNTLSTAPGDVNTEVAALLRDWKGDQPALLARFDRNGDGQIDPGEWAAAREAALQEVIALRMHRPRTSASNLLARPPSDRHPFLLSAVPQVDLARRYRRRALAALVATGIGAGVTLWYIAARLAA
ncbi:MAG: GIDE domain-containing protein [Gammaproteobacteria bacterium]